MAQHTVTFDDATESLVRSAAADGSVEQFIADAVRREALRRDAAQKLLAAVAEADASGPGVEMTPEQVGERLRAVHERVVREKRAS